MVVCWGLDFNSHLNKTIRFYYERLNSFFYKLGAVSLKRCIAIANGHSPHLWI